MKIVIADMGPEWDVGAAFDLIDEYLEGVTPDKLDAMVEVIRSAMPLSPQAIRFPGPNHLLDWLTKCVLSRFC